MSFDPTEDHGPDLPHCGHPRCNADREYFCEECRGRFCEAHSDRVDNSYFLCVVCQEMKVIMTRGPVTTVSRPIEDLEQYLRDCAAMQIEVIELAPVGTMPWLGSALPAAERSHVPCVEGESE